MLLLAVLSLALVACGDGEAAGGTGGDGSATVDARTGLYGGIALGADAPEFRGLGPWLNSEPLVMADLQGAGRVVLVDFWTYTCVNCIRTLPFLKDWHEKYAEHGLTIVGVHSPEFEFEKNPENVARAVEQEDIRYPVAQDDERGTWTAFSNNVWPAKYLFDATGHLLYRHFGEGDYLQTEEAIRGALTAAGADVGHIAVGGVAEPEVDRNATAVTRELYFGYDRNYHASGVYAAQDNYYEVTGQVLMYNDPGPPRNHNQWYAQGRWLNDDEAFVHAEETAGLEDYIAFRFLARTVNPVMHPADGGRAYEVLVELNGEPVSPEEAGPDVTWDSQGRSVVRVDEPRMYRVLELPEVGDHEITLRSNARGFAIYAVTFGVYTDGP